MFEVLVYLFENYIEADIHPDQSTLEAELSAAGFDEGDISRAFDWFHTLEEMTERSITTGDPAPDSLRIYAEAEAKHLGSEGRGFLLFLEQAGVIDAWQRELVIDRAMALAQGEVSLEQLKWIMLMTLWTQDKESDYLFIEDAVFSDSRPTQH